MVSSFEQKIIDDVEEFGWFGLSVAPREDSDDSQEWWTYTVGLCKSHGWPELVIFGQNAKSAHGILAAAISECETRGLVPDAGLRLHDTLNGYDALLAEGDSIPRHYLNSAMWFARHNGIAQPKWLQLLWPDRQGHFPDDPECTPEVVQMQTPMDVE